jgi:hypothetical protein
LLGESQKSGSSLKDVDVWVGEIGGNYLLRRLEGRSGRAVEALLLPMWPGLERGIAYTFWLFGFVKEGKSCCEMNVSLIKKIVLGWF